MSEGINYYSASQSFNISFKLICPIKFDVHGYILDEEKEKEIQKFIDNLVLDFLGREESEPDDISVNEKTFELSFNYYNKIKATKDYSSYPNTYWEEGYYTEADDFDIEEGTVVGNPNNDQLKEIIENLVKCPYIGKIIDTSSVKIYVQNVDEIDEDGFYYEGYEETGDPRY